MVEYKNINNLPLKNITTGTLLDLSTEEFVGSPVLRVGTPLDTIAGLIAGPLGVSGFFPQLALLSTLAGSASIFLDGSDTPPADTINFGANGGTINMGDSTTGSSRVDLQSGEVKNVHVVQFSKVGSGVIAAMEFDGVAGDILFGANGLSSKRITINGFTAVATIGNATNAGTVVIHDGAGVDIDLTANASGELLVNGSPVGGTEVDPGTADDQLTRWDNSAMKYIPIGNLLWGGSQLRIGGSSGGSANLEVRDFTNVIRFIAEGGSGNFSSSDTGSNKIIEFIQSTAKLTIGGGSVAGNLTLQLASGFTGGIWADDGTNMRLVFGHSTRPALIRMTGAGLTKIAVGAANGRATIADNSDAYVEPVVDIDIVPRKYVDDKAARYELSAEVNLDATGSVTIAIPSGITFFPDDVGIIVTDLDGTLTSQPDISIGVTGSLTKYRNAATATALDTLRFREATHLNDIAAGEEGITNTNFVLTIDVAGVKNSATTYKGKLYIRGARIVL